VRHPGTEAARDAAHLRRLNLERVLAAALAEEGAFTRARLIEITGLSAPTVGSLASSLIRSGLLIELGAGPSRGGRRPARMEFNAHYGFAAGIDVGPTRTRLGLADLRGHLHARRIIPTPRETNPGALLSVLAEQVRALMREADVPRSRLLAVAAGAPGAVDPRRGMVVSLSNNLKGWSDVPMAAILRDALDVPVIVENDVNLAVLGEHWKGAARGHDTCAYLTFGTGIGAGVMIDGHLHHGHQFRAGEIGLMCMGPQYVETHFGSRGCLETLTGLGALKARWHSASAESPDWVADLFQAAEAGDGVAQQAVGDAATMLGIATANVCSMLDPSIVVLGGALVAQGDALVAEVRRVVCLVIPSPPPIVVSALEKDASLWGTLLLATHEARARVRRQLTAKSVA
jgi:predicted NBD/HSP70 family sugar kinase